MSILKRKVKPQKRKLQKSKELKRIRKIAVRDTTFDSNWSRIKNFFLETELNLLFLTFLLLTAGLLMIFSASAIRAYEKYNDTFYYFKSQIIWIIIGLVFMTTVYVMPLSVLKKLSTLFLAISIILLLYILPEALFGKTILNDDGTFTTSGLQMPFVVARNGATRWIELAGFSLQPSELIKISFVMYLSAWLTKDFKIKDINSKSEHFKKVLLPFTVLVGFISCLILAERDFDTTVIIFLTVMLVYYVSGNDKIHTLGSGVLFLVSAFIGGIAMVLEPYRRSRLKSFLDLFIHGKPSEASALSDSFQVWNGLVALGSGGLFGVGYGESKQKLGFLQDAAFTDSIFVVIGEEFGLVGAAVVIIGFLYFAVLGYKIAAKAPDKFSSLLALGLTSWVIIQAFFNVSGNISLLPFGGMPLPFFTYGGNTTLMSMMTVGLLLNISRHSDKNSKL